MKWWFCLASKCNHYHNLFQLPRTESVAASLCAQKVQKMKINDKVTALTLEKLWLLNWSDSRHHVWCKSADESFKDNGSSLSIFSWVKIKSHIPPSPSVLETIWVYYLQPTARLSDSRNIKSPPGTLPNHCTLYLTDYSTSWRSRRVNRTNTANVLRRGLSAFVLRGSHFLWPHK